MDVALILQGGEPSADIEVLNGDLITNDGLPGSVFISLFCDRLANIDDVPSGIDRRGWWGDSYLTNNQLLIGSRLWLLQRAKATQDVANLARGYCLEALQWLINTGVASEIDVQTEIVGLYTLAIAVQIYKPDSTEANFQYQYVWSRI